MIYNKEDFDTVKAFGEALSATRDAVRHFVQKRLKEQSIDLTFEMLEVMTIIFEKGKMNQQEIANSLRKDKTSVTYLIDNLTKRGLVLRVGGNDDRRNKIIHLTQNGEQLESILSGIVKEFHKTAGKDLTPDYFKMLTQALLKIKKNISVEE